MNEQTKTFIDGQIRSITVELQDYRTKNNEAIARVQNLVYERRSLYHRCKALVEMAKANPDVDFTHLKDSLRSASWFIHSYEEDEKNSPVEALLSWKLYGKEPFIHGQLYDLIGKDDARTFRALLREVVLLADPTRAGDV